MISSQPFLILAANTSWVYALGKALSNQNLVHCVRIYDWINYWRLASVWPKDAPSANMERSERAFPPGYAGLIEPLVRPFLRSMINNWSRKLTSATGTSPYVICPYPYFATWINGVSDDRLIYFNLDEYTLYRPLRADQIRAQEDELVARATCVLCLAQRQVTTMGARHPEKASRILHFPLGVEDSYILPDAAHVPEPNTVGYIGNLTDRVDWSFVAEVVAQSPHATFRFVGDLAARSDGRNTRWRDIRDGVLSRPNVQHIRAVEQHEVMDLYWSFAVNWMPYDVTHAFNVASCPTKIMDGIASGRPFISTAIPEVSLYPDYIHIVHAPREAGDMIDGFLSGRLAPDTSKQLAFARNNTWANRASELRQILAELE